MIRTTPVTLAAAATLGSLIAAPAPVSAQTAPVEIREWEVPWSESRPRDPYIGPDDRIWFVGQRSDYAAVFEPATGEFRRYDLPDGTGPHNLIVAADGTVWFAGNRDAYIGELDPATGEIVRHEMPEEWARDPHTLIFDAAGDIWFTMQGSNGVGRLDVETGQVQVLQVPSPEARPYGIAMTADGRPWIAEFGTNKIATIDPASMDLREYALPADARPRRLEVGQDGGIWYVDYANGELGRLDPNTGEVRTWSAPGGEEARPYAMATDDQGRLWFVETGPEPNRLVGFDPATSEFFSVTPVLPSGAGTVRHMVFDPETDSIWFGTDTNMIGRASIN